MSITLDANQPVIQTFEISTEAVGQILLEGQSYGQIELTAELTAASPALINYVNETRTYIDAARATIDHDLQIVLDFIAQDDVLFSPNTAYNKDFGNTAGSVTEGNDARLSDARTPVAHTHQIEEIVNLVATLAGHVQLIQDEATARSIAIASELAARQQGDINEANARTAAISAETSARTTAVTNEATARTAAITSENQARTAADTALSGQISTLNGEAVKITGNQDIAGDKTFTGAMTTITGDAIIQGDAFVSGSFNAVSSNDVNIGDRILTLNSELEGTPSLNAGLEVNRGTSDFAQLLWNEATDAWMAGAGSDMVTLVRDNDVRLSDARAPTAHDHDSEYLSLTGGTLSDDLTISAGHAAMVIDAATATTPRLYFRVNGTETFDIQGIGNRTLLRRFHADGNGENRFEMYDDSSRFDHDVRTTAMGVSGDSLTTKAYVDGFVPLTGGTLSGDLIVASLTNSRLAIDSIDGSTPGAVIRIAGQEKLGVFAYGSNAMVRFKGDTSDNLFRLFETYTISAVEIRGVDGTRSDNLTTQQFLADNYLSLAGGTLTGNVTTSGNLSADGSTPYLDVNSTNNQASVRWRLNGARRALAYATSDSLRIRKYTDDATTVTAELVIDDGNDTAGGGFISSNVDVIVEKPTARLNIATLDATDPALALHRDGSLAFLLLRQSGSTLLRHYTGTATDTDLRLYTNSAEFNKALTVGDNLNVAGSAFITGGCNIDGPIEGKGNLQIVNNSPYMTLDCGVGQSAHYQWQYDNNRSALMWSGETSLTLRRYNPANNVSAVQLSFGDNNATSSWEGIASFTCAEVRGPQAVTATGFVTKAQVEAMIAAI